MPETVGRIRTFEFSDLTGIDVLGESCSPGQIRRPLRRDWLRSRRRQAPSQTGPDVPVLGVLVFIPPSALVKFPSSGLRIKKARRRPGRLCPAFLIDSPPAAP